MDLLLMRKTTALMQITAIAVDEDALDGVGSLSGIQCSHVRAGEDLLTQMSQPAASQACHLKIDQQLILPDAINLHESSLQSTPYLSICPIEIA